MLVITIRASPRMAPEANSIWGLRCSGTENRVKVATMHGQLRAGQFTLHLALLGLIG
jgi:hypothetical protein